ncbi:MAG TPA: choice-of-anchor Q domain-containing protein [Polyangia bacterium]
MTTSTFAARTFSVLSRRTAGLAVGLGILLAANPSQATFHVPASQATVKLNSTDGQCSLYEAIDALNQGKTAPGASLHGCVQDAQGGAMIELEGNGAHYKTFGSDIAVQMEIFAYAPLNFAYLEHSGPSAVLTNSAGTASTPTRISNVTIQHTGTNPGRVITNTGRLKLESVTIKSGNVSANAGTAAYGGGIYNSGDGGVELSSVSVISNTAKRGGGIYSATINGIGLTKTSVTNNTATEIGGGLYTGGRLNVTTATISDNVATGNGGGVYCDHGQNSYCSFGYTTISNNKGALGGGVYRRSNNATCESAGTCSRPTLRSSILSGNKNGSNAADDYYGDPHLAEAGGTFETRSLFTTFANTTSHPFDFIGNAGLGALQNNFGMVTKSRAISSTSDAKDKNPAFCPQQDQNFKTRPSGPSCDLGAYELQQ